MIDERNYLTKCITRYKLCKKILKEYDDKS